MTIKVREWKKGEGEGFEVDIRFTYPEGTPCRGRVKAPVESRSAARRWGESRERELLVGPSPSLDGMGVPQVTTDKAQACKEQMDKQQGKQP